MMSRWLLDGGFHARPRIYAGLWTAFFLLLAWLGFRRKALTT